MFVHTDKQSFYSDNVSYLIIYQHIKVIDDTLKVICCADINYNDIILNEKKDTVVSESENTNTNALRRNGLEGTGTDNSLILKS